MHAVMEFRGGKSPDQLTHAISELDGVDAVELMDVHQVD